MSLVYRLFRSVAFLPALVFLTASLGNAASIAPNTVTVSVVPGQTLTLERDVTLDIDGPAASRVDVVFLADNTGSMGGVINTVRNNAQVILDAISGGDPRFAGIDVQFGVASYNGDPREFGGSPESRADRAYTLRQALTDSRDDVTAAIGQWRASGGGDGPEANFFALHQVATEGGVTDGNGSTDVGFTTGAVTGWRDGAARVIVWFGDIVSHTSTVDIDEAIDALVANNVIVAAINTRGANTGIDGRNEASQIAAATGGTLTNNVRGTDNTIDAILNAVESATDTVDLFVEVGTVYPGVSVSYTCIDPLGCTDVGPGETRRFEMSITGIELGSYQFDSVVPPVSGLFATDTVQVRECLNDLTARAKRDKVELLWTDTGADQYLVYRSDGVDGNYQLIGSTVSRYSVYVDRNLAPNASYYYQVREVGPTGTEICSSVTALGRTTTRGRPDTTPINLPPAFTSAPVDFAMEDELYSYILAASDPNGDSLEFSLESGPVGMILDGAELTWTPGNANVGQQTVVVRVADPGGLFNNQVFTIDVANANDAPNIVSSPTVMARVNEPYSYAVNAIDIDVGDALSYDLLQAPGGMEIDAAGLVTWTPEFIQQGDFTVEVQVMDLAGATDEQVFVVTVDAINNPPQITSVPITDITVGGDYSYQVTINDPDDGDIHSYEALESPTGSAMDANTGLFLWSNAVAGTYTVSLRVTDYGGLTATQTFQLNVAEPNVAPEITSTPETTVQDSSLYSYQLEASDADGDPLDYSLLVAPAGMDIDTLGNITWTPTPVQVGLTDVSVQVSDGRAMAVQSFVIDVTARPNTPPQILSTPTTSVERDEVFSYQVDAVDDESDPITYSLPTAPTGMSISPTGLVTWADTNTAGNVTVEVRAADDRGLASVQSFVLTVVESLNIPPVINSVPGTAATAGELYTYAVDATDDDGDPLTYRLANGPAGMTIDTDGVVRWIPIASQVGTPAVEIAVEDGRGGVASQSYTIAVEAQLNNPPVISSTPPSVAKEGDAFSYAVLASDTDGDDLNYSLTLAPVSMTISTGGVISWVPTEEQVGSQSVAVEVDDGNGGFATQSFTVLVQAIDATNEAPVITTAPVTLAVVNTAYSYDVDATDANGDSLSYSFVVAPAGMSIDSGTGLVSWTPSITQLGDQPVEIAVSDSIDTVTQSFIIVVGAEPNSSPIIGSTPPTSAQVGALYQYDVDATDDDGDTLTYGLSLAPAGMGIDGASGLITWVPAAGQVGNQAVNVSVIDGRGGAASQSFSINVPNPGVNEPPVISSAPVTTGTVGIAYSYAVAASDPDGDTLGYSLIAAPAGMTIDPNSGLVSWQPASEQSGPQAVTLRVSDGLAFVDQGFTIDVSEFVLPLDGEIVISPTVANEGDNIVIQVVGSGGQGPRTISLSVAGVATPVVGGVASVVAGPTGRYDVIATLSDDLETIDLSDFFTVRDDSDINAPTASIAAPGDGAAIEDQVAVIGTADDPNLANYRLLVSPVGQGQYLEIANGDTPVVADELGVLDATQLTAGIYDLVLQVTDVNGASSTDNIVFEVAEDTPVGNFSVSFEDLSIPLAGLSITVNRKYDSRERSRNQDFGYGWSVDFQDATIQSNQILGQNFTQTVSGGFFPTYCIEPVGDHYVKIRLPGQRSKRFNLVLQNNCQLLIPPLTVNVAFAPAPGTTGTLSASGSTGLFFLGNELTDLLDTYDPVQFTMNTVEGFEYRLHKTQGVQSVTEPNGSVLTFGNGGIIHSSGAGVAFTRNGSGQITQVTDPDGEVIQYQYNSRGDLAAVIDREGNQFEYRYNRSHGLLDIIDPLNQNISRNIYDDEGRIIAVVDAEGNEVEFIHDTESNEERVIDANGNLIILAYDNQGNVTSETDALGNTTDFTYDASGNRLSETNALGHTTSTSYDANGNPLETTDALGNTTSRSYSATGVILSLEDANGNVTTNTTDSRGNLTSTTDALGNVTSRAYDGQGNPTSSTDKLGFTTTSTYNSSGRIASQTDPLGNVELLTYDSNGKETSSTRTRTVDGSPVPVVRSKEYDRNGRITAEIDAEGARTENAYNGLGQLIRETDARGFHTDHEYDARGNRVRTSFPDGTFETYGYDASGNRTSMVDRAGRTTTFEYDALSRKTRTTFPDGSSTSTEYDAVGNIIAEVDENGNRRTFSYDAADRKTAEFDSEGDLLLQFGYDGNGNVISQTDVLGRTTTFIYDALDRRIGTRYADGTETSTVLDAIGQVLEEVDQSGSSTFFTYDANGKLTSVTDAAGFTTTYTYDEIGNQIAATDAEGRITRWEYDNEGRVLRHLLPSGEAQSYGYDASGNQTSHTDFEGDTTLFEYDSNNRMVRKEFADGSEEIYSYTPTGKLATAIDSSGTTTYSYDQRDRVVAVTYGNGSSVSYTYDAVGNRTSVTTAAGTSNLAYDVHNRLESLTDSGGGVTSYSYDAVGNRALITYPNGNQTSYQYDSLDRLTGIETHDSSTALLSSYTYVLSASGHRQQVTELDGTVTQYAYDAVYRLVREEVTPPVLGSTVIDYTYDGVGNRLTKTVDSVTVNYSYDSNDRLLSAGVVSYTYDDNGNRLTRTDATGTTQYSYDIQNRLATVLRDADVVEYGYDHTGSRVSRSLNGVAHSYVVDNLAEHAQVLLELDPSTSVIAEYTYGDDLISQNRGGTSSFYHYDGNASTRALSDATGIFTDTYRYDAFGNLSNRTGTTTNEYLYTGERFDPNAGFYYLRARYYDPEVGRFTSRDRFPGWKFDPASLHKYNYAHNDPVNNLDPSGDFVSIGFVGGLSRGISLALSRIGPAFAISRTLGGIALRNLGLVVENAVGRILARIPGVALQRGIPLLGQGGARVIDFWAKVGNRVALIEVKYGLPRATGAALTRLVGQMRTALSAGNGAQVVLFTFRAPSAAQMSLLLTQLGPQAGAIQHVSGLWGLVQWARFFFLLP